MSEQRTEHHIACIVSVTGGLEGPCDCGALRTSNPVAAGLRRAMNRVGDIYEQGAKEIERLERDLTARDLEVDMWRKRAADETPAVDPRCTCWEYGHFPACPVYRAGDEPNAARDISTDELRASGPVERMMWRCGDCGADLPNYPAEASAHQCAVKTAEPELPSLNFSPCNCEGGHCRGAMFGQYCKAARAAAAQRK